MKWMLVLISALVTMATTAAQAGGFSGKVVETMNASSYTYVLVETGTNKIWAAANRFPVKVGDVVTVVGSQEMVNFHSPSLNRDFPLIHFAGKISVGGDAAADTLPVGHPPVGGAPAAGMPEGHPAVAPKTAPAPIDFAGLKPVRGGKTVEQVYAESAKLAGKSVKLRGKVVKYNADIMGKNWLHVQDGTGNPGANDILVTTTDTAKRGDTVLVEGKVALKKDFGSGYKYDLLIEDAQVAVE
jgi:hypothetical protein